MEVDFVDDPSSPEEEEALLTTKRGSLQTLVARISGSSRGIPVEKDFHFYNNFSEFKQPIKHIGDQSTQTIHSISTAFSHLFPKPSPPFPDSDDEDDGYDWLVNANDDVLESLDMSLDEFRSLRKKEEERGMKVMDDDGFQVVCGRKNKKSVTTGGGMEEGMNVNANVKVATKAKAKVPFHIASIPRPQDEYKIIVNNSNQPFEHVWLQRAEDGSRFIHPLENCNFLDFIDENVDTQPLKPPPIELTPFKILEEVKDLKELAAKLRKVDEFAVDLEHNQYRSFQGLTCLMQISTRTEDFIVDTLKLRIHIGPHLREIFKDPTKRKVMHGSDRDILWLQRDFGIYVCNMFDTGQASRVLKMERNSLEYLLQHFCGVTANKEYQNADWRLRPLPPEMLRYAREDTHYLLYIYDQMRLKLLSAPSESECADRPLVEVYKRSYDVCMQLYEKELLTESSYLYVYGLQEAGLNAQQLAVVAGLCEWRDVVARAEDESTGYVLPNKTLIEIAKQIPLTTSKLRRLLKSKHPYIERNLGSVVSVIRHSVQNAAAFEVIAGQLNERHTETPTEESRMAVEGSEVSHPEVPQPVKTGFEMENNSVSRIANSYMASQSTSSLPHKNIASNPGSSTTNSRESGEDGLRVKAGTESYMPSVLRETSTIGGPVAEKDNCKNVSNSATGATVQVLKKPTSAFGSLLGNSAKRKFSFDRKEPEGVKLEQIKSTVNLPFFSFRGSSEKSEVADKEPAKPMENLNQGDLAAGPATSSGLGDVILLDSDSDEEQAQNGIAEIANDHHECRNDHPSVPAFNTDQEEEAMSLSELSSSFQECFQSMSETKNSKAVDKSQDSDPVMQLKPFDYEAARKEVRFGNDRERGAEAPGEERGSRSRVEKKSSKEKRIGIGGQPVKGEESSDFSQGKRRQAFPASGNRSATFR